MAAICLCNAFVSWPLLISPLGYKGNHFCFIGKFSGILWTNKTFKSGEHGSLFEFPGPYYLEKNTLKMFSEMCYLSPLKKNQIFSL